MTFLVSLWFTGFTGSASTTAQSYCRFHSLAWECGYSTCVLCCWRGGSGPGGYEINDQDDDEIEFSGNSQSGEIEVDSLSGGTRLNIDIETR
jgi:hypothetical protein